MEIIWQKLVLNVPKAMERPGATGIASGRMRNAFPKVVFPTIIKKLMYSILIWNTS